MESSTPLTPANTPRRDLRLRGVPPRIVEALTRLESSVGSSESSNATPDSPMTDLTFTDRIHSLTSRLLEFVSGAERTRAENIALRKCLQETKQKNGEKEDATLREITRMKISLEDANTQIQNLRNDLELSIADTETLRERTVELEKENLTLERKSQNTLQQCQNLRTNLNKVLREKAEIKEGKNEMEVELASERNRTNILASELQEVLQQLKESETHQPEAADVTAPQECQSCAQRLSLEENLKRKIEGLEADLDASKKETEKNERKLQALAEELRIQVSKEKARAQKLARTNSQLAAQRVNVSQQLKAFEEVLNNAHLKTFHGDAHEDSQFNNGMLHAEEPMTRQEALLRRLGLYRESNSILHTSMRQDHELPEECNIM